MQEIENGEYEIDNKGLIVERTPIYYNERMIDEKINVTLNYQKSDFKNRKEMYNKISTDLTKVQQILEQAENKESEENK